MGLIHDEVIALKANAVGVNVSPYHYGIDTILVTLFGIVTDSSITPYHYGIKIKSHLTKRKKRLGGLCVTEFVLSDNEAEFSAI